MLSRLTIVLLFVSIQTSVFAQKFDKEAFYRAFSSSDVEQINQQLETIDPESSLSAKAYKGALLMKKAGEVKGPKEKLETFKEGKELLDGAIAGDPENGEFRFLRLVIQEQAPAILNYNDKKDEDAQLVINDYQEFPKIVKNFIKNYSQTSEKLKPDDFE